MEGKMENFKITTETSRFPEDFVKVTGGTIKGNDYYKPGNYGEGVFPMGRTVTLSDFYIGKYEITQAEYKKVMANQKVTANGKEYTLNSDPSFCKEGSTEYALDLVSLREVQENRPVEGVTWYDAVYYCNARSEKEGLTKAYNIAVWNVDDSNHITAADVTLVKNANGYRLPSEAEWEYAARGGEPKAEDWNYVFSGADTVKNSRCSVCDRGMDGIGWYCYNNTTGLTLSDSVTEEPSGKGTHEVGRRAPNRLNIYDMCGNVFEWCYDWNGGISASEKVTDPLGPVSGDSRIIRGGSWIELSDEASVSYRDDVKPEWKKDWIGFRVARSVQLTDKSSSENIVSEKENSSSSVEKSKKASTETSKFPDDFVKVSGGTIVGTDDAKKAGVFPVGRTVTLSDFYIGKYEITQAEYRRVMAKQKVIVNGKEYELAATPSLCKKGSKTRALDIEFLGEVQENRPVENITWYDAVYYCNARSEKEGLTKAYDMKVVWVLKKHIIVADVALVKNANGYRLPTEAEWEYAARGGDPKAKDWNYKFSGADTNGRVDYFSSNSDLDSVGWYNYNNLTGMTHSKNVTYEPNGIGCGTHEVGKKAPNRLGLYDMSGNVFEWCYDRREEISCTENVINPVGSASEDATGRIRRGGCWALAAGRTSVTNRESEAPDQYIDYVGLRVVRSAQ